MYNNNEHEKIALNLIKEWAPLLEGLESEEEVINMAIMLENTYNWHVNSSPDGQMLQEFTGSSTTGPSGQSPQIATFKHYLMPLIRRMYPALITPTLVGVTPMTSPATQVFYLKYFYNGMVNQQDPWGTTPAAKGRTTAGTEYANFIGDTWNVDPYYSMQTVYREPLSTGGGTIGAGLDFSGAPDTGTHVAVQAASPIFDSSTKVYLIATDAATHAASTKVALIEVSGFANGTTTGTLAVSQIATLAGSDAFDNAVTGGITAATGTFSMTVSNIGNYDFILSNTESLNVTTHNGLNTLTYDFNMENNPRMPEISLEIASTTVNVETRKLRTVWSIESAQDMRAMHHIDAEKELVSLLSSEIAAEIDRETINNLITNSGHRRNYDYNNPFIVGGFAVGGGTGLLNWNQSASLPAAGGNPWFPVGGSGNLRDRNEALMYQILEMSNDIYRQTLRGAANFIITSPEIASKLEQLSEFEATQNSVMDYSLGIQQAGVIQGKYRLIKDPLFPSDLILLGYKGANNMDAGYHYCPYVPLQLTPTMMDTRSTNAVKAIMTRYGKFMPENGSRFYGIIKVSNLTAQGSATPSGFPIQTSTSISGSNLIDGDSDLV